MTILTHVLSVLSTQPIPYRARGLAHVPRLLLWNFLSDTDRLNRAMNMPAIQFIPLVDRLKKGHYEATLPIGPFRLRYEETPFDWVHGEYFRAHRLFHNGPFQDFVMTIRLRDVEGGTEITIEGTVQPRNLLGVFIGHTILGRLLSKDLLALSKRLESLPTGTETPDAILPPPAELIDTHQLTTRFSKLDPWALNAELIHRLETFLMQGSDLEVSGIRPFVLADTWHADRQEVLRLLLYAAKAQIMDLKWVVLCPNCRAPNEEPKTLAELKSKVHCPTCEIHYGTDLASSVEAQFSVNAAVRLSRHQTYCIGGPANQPEILAQLHVSAGTTRTETLTVAPGRVRMGSVSYTDSFYLTVVNDPSGPDRVTVRLGETELNASEFRVRSGPLTLEVQNNSSLEKLFVIQKETWAENAVTAARVTSLQDFRDLFPEEAVAPGEEIGITSLTILFTDLSASTALYQSVGDAAAFSMIQKHFHYLTDVVRSCHGGLVKLMGDAVMATFPSNRDALEAAVLMQSEWLAFCREHQLPKEVTLKIGLHAGPCISINNRGAMDYFGTTINLAARVESQARPGEILFTELIYNDPAVQIFLEEHHLAHESYRSALRGIDGEQTLHRLHAPYFLKKAA